MSVSHRWGGHVGCPCEQGGEAHGNKGVGAPWPSPEKAEFLATASLLCQGQDSDWEEVRP